MPVGGFKSQQFAVWLFSDVADDLHIFAFQVIPDKFDILHLQHNPCLAGDNFTFALRFFSGWQTMSRPNRTLSGRH